MYTHQEWWLLWLLLTGLISVTGTDEADPLNSSTPHFWPMINVLAWHQHLPLCVWGIILSLIFSWRIIKHFQSSSDRSHTIRGRQFIPTIYLFMQIDPITAWKEYLSARRQAGSQIWSDAGNNMVMGNSHKPTGLHLIHFDSWWLPWLKYTSTHRKYLTRKLDIQKVFTCNYRSFRQISCTMKMLLCKFEERLSQFRKSLSSEMLYL